MDILAAKSAPSFIVELTDQRAAVGESAKFLCKFAGTPRPGTYIDIKSHHPPKRSFFFEPNKNKFQMKKK